MLSGDEAAASALHDAKAAVAVVGAMAMYSEQLEQVEWSTSPSPPTPTPICTTTTTTSAAAAAATATAAPTAMVPIEQVEGAMAALMQLATLDLPGCMEAGLGEAVVRSMHSRLAGGWLQFLCAPAWS